MRRLNTYKDCADRTWFGKLFQQLVRRHANEKDLALFVQCVLNTLKSPKKVSEVTYFRVEWAFKSWLEMVEFFMPPRLRLPVALLGNVTFNKSQCNAPRNEFWIWNNFVFFHSQTLPIHTPVYRLFFFCSAIFLLSHGETDRQTDRQTDGPTHEHTKSQMQWHSSISRLLPAWIMKV